jgi:hypothetical protein
VDAHKKHQTVHKKYRNIDPKKREAYKAKHVEKIAEYEAAVMYLKTNLNGRDKIPEREWKAERDSLLVSRYSDVDRYYKLREDIKNAENIRRGAENHMLEIVPEYRQIREDISI